MDWFWYAVIFAVWGFGMAIAFGVAMILFGKLKKECHGLIKLVEQKEDFIADLLLTSTRSDASNLKLCKQCPMPAIAYRLMEDRASEDEDDDT